MQPEEYNQYGEIKPSGIRSALDHQHRIHMTKDIIVGDCWACQKALHNNVNSYWYDNDWVDDEDKE